MNSIIPLQNSPERVSLLPIAPGVDFATAVALRRMATSTGATPAYLLAPEVSALLWYRGSRFNRVKNHVKAIIHCLN